MLGSATFTIEASTTTMNCVVARSRRASVLARGLSPGGASPVAAGAVEALALAAREVDMGRSLPRNADRHGPRVYGGPASGAAGAFAAPAPSYAAPAPSYAARAPAVARAQPSRWSSTRPADCMNA
jgi:hypothetical protein